jgi:hypothetical protein
MQILIREIVGIHVEQLFADFALGTFLDENHLLKIFDLTDFFKV